MFYEEALKTVCKDCKFNPKVTRKACHGSLAYCIRTHEAATAVLIKMKGKE